MERGNFPGVTEPAVDRAGSGTHLPDHACGSRPRLLSERESDHHSTCPAPTARHLDEEIKQNLGASWPAVQAGRPSL